MSTQTGDISNQVEAVIAGMKNRRKMFLVFGIIMMVLGVLAIALPHGATIAIEVLIGWLLIFGGIAQFVHAVGSHGARGLALKIAWSILYFIVGAVLLAKPFQGAVSLTLLLAALFFFGGIFKAVASFQIRSTPGWGWLLFSGIAAMVLGIIIWAGWPGDASWVLGLIVGIDLIFGGFWMIMFANGLRRV